jgi:hypothetical protein
MFIFVLWCVLPVVIGAMRTIVLRAPDPSAKLTLQPVRAVTPIAGAARDRREA